VNRRKPLTRDEMRRAVIMLGLLILVCIMAAIVEPCDGAPDCRAPTAIKPQSEKVQP